ncbi:MAG TPA: thiol reductase thioredoxin [Janthinobacterium sp.]|nr:thiol reductase thioredoxin [Janthinobacterium sp.]
MNTTTAAAPLHIVCPHCDAVNRLPAARLAAQPSCGKCQKDLFTGQPLDLAGARFQKHIERNDIAVLVDFWAPWCGPCRSMAPAYAQAAQRLEPLIRVIKLNTEEAQDISARYAIRSIPTLALFRDGREVARQAGAMDAANIVAWARQHAGLPAAGG